MLHRYKHASMWSEDVVSALYDLCPEFLAHVYDRGTHPDAIHTCELKYLICTYNITEYNILLDHAVSLTEIDEATADIYSNSIVSRFSEIPYISPRATSQVYDSLSWDHLQKLLIVGQIFIGLRDILAEHLRSLVIDANSVCEVFDFGFMAHVCYLTPSHYSSRLRYGYRP